MTSSENESENETNVISEPKEEEDMKLPAPTYKLKKMIPKREDDSISEKEKARRERLSQQLKERHAKQRAEKERYEKEQLDKIAKKLSVKVKAKQVKEKVKQIDSDSSTDDESLREYLEYKKFKQQKRKPTQLKEINSDDDVEDKKVIMKTKKATEVLEAVSKLDQTIQNLNGGYVNPYLAFFNSRK
jgi:hypothetical protein